MRRVVAVLAARSLTFAPVVLTRASPAQARGQRMRLTSPAFATGAMIPIGFTCDDQDVPPPLRWSGLPALT
ncbi:MAG TPA: YbhB/YbcL family Raf kinase inhibitor-like protein, partial [Acidimicrobiia bacterium]